MASPRLTQSITLLLCLLIMSIAVPVSAGELLLSANRDTGLSEFFIEGEPSLVMNGFDLNALGFGTPAQLDAVAISVVEAVPGVPVDVLIYEDANGGSPVDSVLIARTQTTINGSGVIRVALPQPATINAPVVWVGMYLPVGFRFGGDTSGNSGVTWWAWNPGGIFDPTSLANAPVLGPGDGSSPVGIEMGGIARITAEITAPAAPQAPASSLVPVEPQNNLIDFDRGDVSISAAVPAGQVLLDNNIGGGQVEFFVEGENTLVMNGFDLRAKGSGTEIFLNSVYIALLEIVPGLPIEAVVYADDNGGSPADARVVARTRTTVTTPGVTRIQFADPIRVSTPVLWVGFYLPPGFRFTADDSGADGLTWWAWTPGSTFNLDSLASAAVLGPGDGSDPVGIDMQGTARITAAVTPLSGVTTTTGQAPQTLLIDRPVAPVPSNLIAPGQDFPTDSGAPTSQVTNNSGSDLNEFFIDGEPSLILNGFDLGAAGISLPADISALGIAITNPIPGVPIDVVVYEDSNGGSPEDSVLVGRNQVFINSAGNLRVPFPEAVRVNSSIIWVGFYLPVGTRFAGDSSGSSVLTWWAWKEAGTFDVVSLANADVLGPANGSEPVGIDMGGVARITAEITPVDFIPEPGDLTIANFPIGVQLVNDQPADLSSLRNYTYCGDAISYDSADLGSAGNAFTIECRADVFQSAAGTFININDTPSDITTFERVGYLYDLKAYGDYQVEGGPFATELRVPVTHCMRPEQIHLETAVIGLRFAQPGNWKILPTVRFGDLICAEVEHEGLITYFIPRNGTEATINADIDFGGPLRITGNTYCNAPVELTFAIHNEGFVTIPATTVTIRDVHPRSGLVEGSVSLPLGPILPDETVEYYYLYRLPTTNFNDLHRIEIIVDPLNIVAELNEGNNTISLEYIMETAAACS